jgi:hypothetical protein
LSRIVRRYGAVRFGIWAEFRKQEGEMNQAENSAAQQKDNPPERIPAMQQILDNPFLLLFIGITIPTVLYIVWGVMEIASIPVGN